MSATEGSRTARRRAWWRSSSRRSRDRLGDGEKVQITGFGTFVIRQKRERRGRNPQTGEEMLIRPRSSVVFRPSKLFVPAVNADVNE